MQDEKPKNNTNATSRDVTIARVSTQPYSPIDYDEFIFWFALPTSERRAAGAASLSDYAIKHGMERRTLWRWQNRPDFHPRVGALRMEWGKDMTSSVLDGWKLSCMKGNPLSIELWLGFFHGYVRKQEIDHTQKKVEIGINDIRHLINQLPEQLRNKHNANLRELLDDASAVANARSAEDSSWANGFTDPISDEADHDAQDISSQRADEVSARYPGSIRANMVGEPYARDNQSPSRRWKE